VPNYLRREKRAWNAHTDGSPGKLEVALARKAATIARLYEAGVENKGTFGAMLSSVIPEVVISPLYATRSINLRVNETRLTLLVLTMLQPCLTGMRH
jgi:hypothetical protein